MSYTETLKLLEAASAAIFEAEQVVRIEENASVNGPMYRMRINLGEVIERYKSGQTVCDWATPSEMAGRF